MSLHDRVITLDSVQNMRDLGGLPTADGRRVRRGRLYRADGVHRLAPQDIEPMRALGLATVIDLRSENEVTSEGTFPVETIPVTFVHVPTVDEGRETFNPPVPHEHPQYLYHSYLRMFERNGQTLARSFTAVAEASGAATLFHCTAGKDRTGILSMLILGVLGVDHELIIEDYAMSGEAVAKIKAWTKMHHPDIAVKQEKWPDRLRSADPDNMRLLIEWVVQNHGSISDLVAQWGVDGAAMEKLRTNLIV